MDEWKRQTADPLISQPEPPERTRNLKKLLRQKEFLLALLILAGAITLLWPHDEPHTTQSLETLTPQEKTILEDTQQKMAEQVQHILSQISGIGTVDVSLTLDSDGMKEYAFNQTAETRQSHETGQNGIPKEEKTISQSQDVAISGGNALLVKKHYPQVAGVLVVAQGAKDPVMQQKICDAVAVLLDISPHRVRVLAGEEKKS